MSKAKLAFFIIGALALFLATLLEFGSTSLLSPLGSDPALPEQSPGIGIFALFFIDVVLAYNLFLIGLDFLPTRAAFARIQGVITLVLSVLLLLFTFFVFVLGTFTMLMLMLGLLMSPPFGTLAYFAIWGDFETGQAKFILGVVMLFKLGGALAIVLSNPSFLKNKGFVALFACSVGATFLLGLLHAFPPFFLVSITDAVGAIVAGIVGAFWMGYNAFGAIFAVIRAVRSVSPV